MKFLNFRALGGDSGTRILSRMPCDERLDQPQPSITATGRPICARARINRSSNQRLPRVPLIQSGPDSRNPAPPIKGCHVSQPYPVRTYTCLRLLAAAARLPAALSAYSRMPERLPTATCACPRLLELPELQ